MTNKEKKIGAVKFVAFILKEIINSKMPAGFIANILNEGLSEGTDYLSGQIEGNEIGNGSQIIDEILTDTRLKTLYIQEDYYDMVRSNVRSILKIISIDDELLRSCSYEEKEIAREVIKRYQEAHSDLFTQQELLYLEKGLNEIVSVLVWKIAKQPDAMTKILGRTEDVLKAINQQGKQQQYGYDQIQKSIEESQAANSQIQEENRLAYQQIQKGIDELKDLVERQSVMGETMHLYPDFSEMYANRWTERMFLHRDDDNEWNQNITLENIYQLPSYQERGTDYFNLEQRLKKLVSETKQEKRMLLVLGQPGGGKSTLITYLLNECITNCDREILVYQFAKLNETDWARNPRKALLEALGAKHVKEFSGKVLILDGFDEITVNGSRERILDQLYDDIAMDYSIRDFSLLITCREHYITGKTKCDRILLNPFTEQQIENFCSTYWHQFGVAKEDPEALKKQFCEKKAIMGIPLLLYMTLTLDITIEEDTSYVDIYDKIFAIDGGIYDRGVAVVNKDGRNETYLGGSHPITREIKQQLHRISKEIALYMLEYEPDTASIPQEAYKQIVERIQQEESLETMEQGVPISIYFQKIAKQIDGVDTEQLTFIHRSMYEYFVAVAVCDEIVDANGRLIQQGNEREMINRLTPVLCRRQFSDDSKQYLEYRIQKHICANNQADRDQCADWWRKVCDTMLTEGIVMKEVPFWSCAEKQAIGFVNFIPLMRGILEGCKQELPYQIGNVERIGENIRNANTMENRYDEKIIDLAFINLIKADLRGANLRGADLRRANLIEADLLEANLLEANLRGANLIRANLIEADLRRANLIEADLRGANLIEADLIGADLIGADLSGANLSEANLRRANLRRANLSEANLIEADLRRADLRGADLIGADLIGADLIEVDLGGADLRVADLRRANLSKANFTGANVEGADFTDALGIESCIGLDLN